MSSLVALLLLTKDVLWRRAVESATVLAGGPQLAVLALQHQMGPKQDLVCSLISADSSGAEMSLAFGMCLQRPPIACVLCGSACFYQVTDYRHLAPRVLHLECLSGVGENISRQIGLGYPVLPQGTSGQDFFEVEKG